MNTHRLLGLPIIAGYPFTNKTLATREAYIQRWGDIPDGYATAAYDAVRFILPDAIRRAGTTETQAVIKALEKTDDRDFDSAPFCVHFVA